MTACVRPGCTGTYEADGYCDQCGHRSPETVPPPATPSRPTRPTGPSTGRRRTSTVRTRPAGVLSVPPIPRRDPLSAVLTDPQVPKARRVCRRCGHSLNRDHGFCPRDRTPYSFVPRLARGELVERRYEIQGCLAYGGLGWVYLAKDTKLGDTVAERWVVLKGLIDVGDPDAVAAAVNERRFLVEVDHPNIVKIYDFAQHQDPFTGAMVGYIVMEYLGGRSLHDIYGRHLGQDGEREPLPLPTVLDYGAEVLRALGYLHEKGLVYCDLKPDNVIQVEDQVKLIDLGAVLRMSDRTGSVYGTPGYQAPELERETDPADPSVASDLYTVGRMLAVLSFDFAGFTGTYRHRLPEPAGDHLLAREESFHRLLRRATHPDPARRFESAAEMREQLQGVRAEVLSIADGEPRWAGSERFTQERRVFGTGAGLVSTNGDTDPLVRWTTLPQALPTPLVDLADPAAAFLATMAATDPDELIETLGTAPVRSPEVVLRLVEARIAAGDLDGARTDLAQFTAANPLDWRAAWVRGLLALAESRPDTASEAFSEVYDALPGELAPKLALAAAAEWHGDDDRAEALYDRVWRTDTGCVSAVFGLARVLRRGGRLPEVVAALDEVPETSSQHVVAQVAAIRARLDPNRVARAELVDASDRLTRLQMDIVRQARLSIEVLTAQLNWTLRYPKTEHDFDERQLREQLERAFRNLAKVADDPDEKSRLVDQANQVRPKTLL